MQTVKILRGLLPLLLPLVLVPYLQASAESSSRTMQAAGSVILLNNSPHSGLWVATSNFDTDKADLVSVFNNKAGDIYVVTLRGDDPSFRTKTLTITGKAFIAKNGVLVSEGSGTATINEVGMKIKISGDILISGRTTSFKIK